MAREITREHLLKQNLKLRLRIEQVFTDADSWNQNVRKEGEPKINPDPKGEMAAEWLNLQEENIRLSEFFKPAMTHHFNFYGSE